MDKTTPAYDELVSEIYKTHPEQISEQEAHKIAIVADAVDRVQRSLKDSVSLDE